MINFYYSSRSSTQVDVQYISKERNNKKRLSFHFEMHWKLHCIALHPCAWLWRKVNSIWCFRQFERKNLLIFISTFEAVTECLRFSEPFLRNFIAWNVQQHATHTLYCCCCCCCNIIIMPIVQSSETELMVQHQASTCNPSFKQSRNSIRLTFINLYFMHAIVYECMSVYITLNFCTCSL